MGLFRKKISIEEIIGGIIESVPPAVSGTEGRIEIKELDISFDIRIKDIAARAVARQKSEKTGALTWKEMEFLLEKADIRSDDIFAVRISFRRKYKTC